MPLLRLSKLSVCDLSNNRLTALGQLRFMSHLSSLNVETNELRVKSPPGPSAATDPPPLLFFSGSLGSRHPPP